MNRQEIHVDDYQIQWDAVQGSCDQATWRQRCRKISQCGGDLPNLQEKCARRYGIGGRIKVFRKFAPLVATGHEISRNSGNDRFMQDFIPREVMKSFSAKIISGTGSL